MNPPSIVVKKLALHGIKEISGKLLRKMPEKMPEKKA